MWVRGSRRTKSELSLFIPFLSIFLDWFRSRNINKSLEDISDSSFSLFPPSSRAGAALVLSKTASAPTSGWESYKTTSPVFQKLADIRERYDESEDPFISKVRSVTGWFGRLADENETAKVTRLMRIMDPGFEVEMFARELREYIVPEVLDAYLTGDQESLKGWCGEAVSSRSLSL